jgi:hypothetical protein
VEAGEAVARWVSRSEWSAVEADLPRLDGCSPLLEHALQVHGVGPWLSRHLSGAPASSAARTLAAHLRHLETLSAARAATIGRVIDLARDASRDAGVPIVPLKGAAMAASVMPDQALRPSADVDVLVRPADEARFVGACARFGYRPVGGSSRNRVLAPDAPEVEVRCGEDPAIPVKIEVHTRVVEANLGLGCDLTGMLWDAARPAPDRALWLTPPPDVLLLHAATHGARDLRTRTFRLLRLLDLPALIGAMLNDPASQLRRRSAAVGADRYLWAFLALAERYVAHLLPAGAPRAAEFQAPASLERLIDGSPLSRFTVLDLDAYGTSTLTGVLPWAASRLEWVGAARRLLMPTPSEIQDVYGDEWARSPLRFYLTGLGALARRSLGGRQREVRSVKCEVRGAGGAGGAGGAEGAEV